jgi:hypothetical protein
MLTFNSRASSERVIELELLGRLGGNWRAGLGMEGKVSWGKRMEQTKSYVKLYIVRADEYQSKTSLNHPLSVFPLMLILRTLRLRRLRLDKFRLRQATVPQARLCPALVRHYAAHSVSGVLARSRRCRR